MKYNQLGNSGLVVSELALGTMTFGEGDYYGLQFTFNQAAATALVQAAIDKGINFIDTADMYGNGQSEVILGKALGDRRKDVIVASKIAFRSDAAAFRAGTNAKHLLDQAHRSLKNLNTDYLDVLLLHNDDPITPIDETLRALELLVQKGMVRYIGLSNFQAWKAGTMVQRQKDLHYAPFVASQMHYSLLNREVEHEFVPMSLHHGIGMMVWSPLSSGFLTGKYTRENPAPEGGRLNSFDLGLFDRNRAYDVVEQVNMLAKKHNTTASAVSIAWLLSKRVVASVIVGVSKMEQLQGNLDAVDVKLSAEDILQLDELTQPAVRYPGTFVGLQDGVLKAAKNSQQ